MYQISMDREEELAKKLLQMYDPGWRGIRSNVDRLLRFASMASGESPEEVRRYYETLKKVAQGDWKARRYGNMTLAALTIILARERNNQKLVKYLGDYGELPINDKDLE